jgi:hypothetical protein
MIDPLEISELRSDLSMFGQVRMCGEYLFTFEVVIRNFKIDSANLIEVEEIIKKAVGKVYPQVKKFECSEGIFRMILKPKARKK